MTMDQIEIGDRVRLRGGYTTGIVVQVDNSVAELWSDLSDVCRTIVTVDLETSGERRKYGIEQIAKIGT